MNRTEEVLMSLIGANTKDDLSDDNIKFLPEEIRAELEQIDAEKKKQLNREAALIIKDTLEKAELMKKKAVSQIREARSIEASAKGKLKRIERAIKYAQATNNYLPLRMLTIGVIGISGNCDKFKMCFVPDDWDSNQDQAEIVKQNENS